MATTSNMGLTLPDVSVTPGPTWASQINSDLSLIDSHNHTSGYGAPVPVAGLDINESLSFGNNAATGLSYLQLNPQAATAATSSLYVDSNGDFFYNNALGAQVQITSGGGLAALPGSITGLPSGTAAVTFSSGLGSYSFTKATNQAAVVEHGPLVLRTGAIGSKAVGIGINPSGSNYVLTLPPSLPSTRSMFTIDPSGVGGFAAPNSTLAFSGVFLKVADLGVGAAQLATDAVETAKIKDAQVTYAKLQAANIVAPAVGGYDTVTSSNYIATPIPSFSIVAVGGRPLFLQCVAAGIGIGNDESSIEVAGNGRACLRFFDASYGGVGAVSLYTSAAYAGYSPSVLSVVIANIPAGSYTFYIQAKVDSGATLTLNNIKVVAYQI